jgi:hypothetical protein
MGEMISDERGKVGTQGGNFLLLITTPLVGLGGRGSPTFFFDDADELMDDDSIRRRQGCS